jgi:hypothetical protein
MPIIKKRRPKREAPRAYGSIAAINAKCGRARRSRGRDKILAQQSRKLLRHNNLTDIVRANDRFQAVKSSSPEAPPSLLCLRGPRSSPPALLGGRPPEIKVFWGPRPAAALAAELVPGSAHAAAGELNGHLTRAPLGRSAGGGPSAIPPRAPWRRGRWAPKRRRQRFRPH